MTKICKRCKQEKDDAFFRYTKNSHFLWTTTCLQCREQKITANKIVTDSTQIRVELKRLIKGTLFIKQNKQCAICFEPLIQAIKKIPLDHDHKTGRIRGLLCSNCNTALGFFKDNEIILYNAIIYLRNSKNNPFDIEFKERDVSKIIDFIVNNTK